MDDAATEAEAGRFGEVDDPGLRDRVRDANPWILPSGRPERELAARRMADRHDGAEPELRSGKAAEMIDPRCDVVERRRPAAAGAEPAVLEVPGRPARLDQVRCARSGG